MLTCDDLRKDLDAFLNGRLDPERCAAFEAHCARCDACLEHVQSATALEKRLRNHYRDEPVPPGLWPRIRASIAAEQRASAGNRRVWTTVALAAGMLLAVGITAIVTGSGQAPGDNLTTVLVNELRTFVISRRNLDVASADPLALRGWFVDKVEFSPPSPPDAGGTLELVGGRLCNILDQRVISFMYRTEGRPVSLYVMRDRAPEDGDSVEAPEVTEMNGFRHVGWKHAGLRYSLVADLPVERVKAIARTLMQETGSQQARWNELFPALGTI